MDVLSPTGAYFPTKHLLYNLPRVDTNRENENICISVTENMQSPRNLVDSKKSDSNVLSILSAFDSRVSKCDSYTTNETQKENENILINLLTNSENTLEVGGQKSPGILQLSDKFENTPDISCFEMNASTRIFDTGFLFSSPRLSLNSNSGIFSFNSSSVDFPSKIYSIPSNHSSFFTKSTSKSFLNNAYFISSNSLVRSRFLSQPLETTNNMKDHVFWSARKPTTTKFLIEECVCPPELSNIEVINDSVFLDDNNIDSKNINGLLCVDDPECDILDSTPQPDWPDFDDSDIKNESQKGNAENDFKTIDKMFPDLSAEPESKVRSRRASTQSDAQDILQNLSEIFNTSTKSEKQRSHGLVLLNSLIHLLKNSPKCPDLDDSGHSSILENEMDVKDVQTTSPDVEKFSKTENLGKKRLSRSLCIAESIPANIGRTISLASPSNIMKCTNIPSTKLRSSPLTGNPKGPMKAITPVQHMIRLHVNTGTPESLKQKSLSKKTSTPLHEPRLKPLAASTPSVAAFVSSGSPKSPNSIARRFGPLRTNSNEKIETVANQGAKQVAVKSSFQNEPVSVNKTKLPGPSKPLRRNSISEGMVRRPVSSKIQHRTKKSSDNEKIIGNQYKLHRSNSVGKETGMMSSLPKIRENILKSTYYEKNIGILSPKNDLTKVNVAKRVKVSELDNSVKLRKNKETIHH